MANRTGTYFAFDGLGQTDPSKSDFKYYATVQAWAAGKHINFNYVDSHLKTSAVRDSSKRPTLEARIRERLAASKNIVIILSANTRNSGSMLSYEIEKAVDTYSLPLIIAYTGYNTIFEPSQLSHRWPNSLKQRIHNKSAKAIHIPFKKLAVLDAINQFYINGKTPKGGSLGCYSKETYRKWEYL